MKIVDVPPCRAYVCIAFLMDSIDGALPQLSVNRARREDPSSHSQDSFQGFLVNRHLDRDVGKVVVHNLVWTWFNGGIVLGILVVMRDGTDSHGYVLDDLNGKEKGDTVQERHCRDECEPLVLIVELEFVEDRLETVTKEVYGHQLATLTPR